MYSIIECVTQMHDYSLLSIAVVICVVGACLSVLLAKRVLYATGRRKQVQIALSSLIAGATVWSTHFVAMLAYDPGFEHGFEPFLTGLSLLIAVGGVCVANEFLAMRDKMLAVPFGGMMFGLTVVCMHYTGMSAYLLPGTLNWDPAMVLASIVFGVALSIAAYHRIAFPVTRYCWLGGAGLLVLAICAMHFTGMSAFSIELSPLVDVPPKIISNATLSYVVTGVMSLILLIGFAAIAIETNMEQEAHVQLQYAALHDPLTGLPNRMRLTQKMTEFSDELEADETAQVALLTIDLNRFKEVNDVFGHGTGDTVLKTVAQRLSEILEPTEFLSRSGGDEFLALKHKFTRVEEVVDLAERMRDLIVEPINCDGILIQIGVSIGIATTLQDGRVLRDLIHKSDMAMYRAKIERDGDVCVFDAEMDQKNRDKIVLINDLRLAIPNGELELVYQLQNDLISLEPVGFEALLRWNHPERGRVSPEVFIPVAEEAGLIRDIGLWVLRSACMEAAQWDTSYSIAVNVAPQQLTQFSFVEQVSDILMETGLDPERLELEVTEASIIDDQRNTLETMVRLKEMGIRIAMDDFGTGYSSLATLRAFPFDKIKIDRSFVQDVHRDHQRAAIVRSTLLLAHALDIPVLAEGVEVEEELAFLSSEKCSSVQGFLFGKPMSREEMRFVVAANGTKKAYSGI